MSRRAEVLAYLAEHPGATAFTLGRVLASGRSIERVLRDMYHAGLIVAVPEFRPDQGRLVRNWHAAPPGTPPVPRSQAERDAKRRRDRDSARRRRNKAAAATLPRAVEVSDLRGAACAGEDPDLFFSGQAGDIANDLVRNNDRGTAGT